MLFIYILRFRCLIHPGFYFAVIWLISTLSQWYLITLDFAFLPFPQYVDDLNVFVLFSSIFFSFWVIVYSSRIKSSPKSLGFADHPRAYIILSYVTLFAAFAKVIYIWMSLGIYFNLGAIRIAITDKSQGAENYNVGSGSVLYSFINYFNFFYKVVAIIAGYYFCKKFVLKESVPVTNFQIAIPFIVSILYVLAIGGRNPLAEGLKLYLFGIALIIPYKVGAALGAKLLYRGLLLASFFLIFTTLVADQRAVSRGTDSSIRLYESNFDKLMSGMYDYMSSHYWGYQLRMNDSYDPQRLGYGYYTFEGFYVLQLPLAQYHGLEGTAANFFGIEENRIDYWYLFQRDMPGYFTTRSVFLEAVMDFGKTGVIVFLFLFTWYSTWIVARLNSKKFDSTRSLFFLYLCFAYWGASNFSPSYTTKIELLFLMFLLYDFLVSQVFVNKSRTNISRQLYVQKSDLNPSNI